MSDNRLSATFSNWSDRLTYVVAEAQLLVGASIVAFGILLWAFDISLPGVPVWVSDLLVGWFVLGPIMFIAGLKFVGWLRVRNYDVVYHTNAVEDVREKYYVPPDLWSAKNVQGPAPHPVNDGDAYEVREFNYAPEYGDGGQLTVTGNWLSELSDAKLVTAKAHFERAFDELIDDHLELTYRRDAEDDLAARIQRRLVNRFAEARENGEMLEPDDVRDVIEEFKTEMRERTDREDISNIRPDDVPDHTPPALPQGEQTHPYAGAPGGESDVHGQPATDGGGER